MEKRMIAFVAVKKDKYGSGMTFAYLPNTEVQLPAGWKWAKKLGSEEIGTEDVTEIAAGDSLEETCRMMSAHTGLTF